MTGDGDVTLPPIGQTGRLHVAGRSVPVEVYDHVLNSLTLEVVEEGWSLTDGDARLVVSGDDGTGMIAGAVRVPLYARNSPEAHAHMIGQTGAVVLLTDAAYADSVKGLDATVDCLRHVVVRDATYEDWLASQPPGPEPRSRRP